MDKLRQFTGGRKSRAKRRKTFGVQNLNLQQEKALAEAMY